MNTKLENGGPVVLKRQLGLFTCFFYGVAALLPIAPVPVYGVANDMAGGHIAMAYFIAMIAMSFSAWTYGQFGAELPYAGSSYTFVRKGINSQLGFLTGWAIMIDYLFMPGLNYLILGLFLNALFPALPTSYIIYVSIIVVCIINLLGIKNLSKINNFLTVFGFLVCFYFIYSAFVSMGHGVGTGFSSVAFYNPETFSWSKVLSGASVAAFSFLGFDVLTTLSEETINPKKTLPKATLLVCFVMGIIFTIFCFVSQAVFPSNVFSDPNTAFLDVAKAAGGTTLANLISIAMVAGAIAYSMDMLAAVSRLLFGMGRDGVLPKKIFGYVSPKTGVPVYNTIIVSLLCVVISSITLDRLIPLINFGGLFAYTMVNLSCVIYFFVRGQRRQGWDVIKYLVLPTFGFLTMFTLWLSLDVQAKTIGFIWLAIGIIYMAYLTKGFRKPMPEMNLDS